MCSRRFCFNISTYIYIFPFHDPLTNRPPDTVPHEVFPIMLRLRSSVHGPEARAQSQMHQLGRPILLPRGAVDEDGDRGRDRVLHGAQRESIPGHPADGGSGHVLYVIYPGRWPTVLAPEAPAVDGYYCYVI